MKTSRAIDSGRVRTILIAILALVVGLGLATSGVSSAQASAGRVTPYAAPGDVYCQDDGYTVTDVTVTLDPAIYGTGVGVVAEVHENNNATGERLLYVVNAITDAEGVALIHIWVSDDEDISTGWELYYYDPAIDDYEILPDDATVSQRPHDCTPPGAKVCVIATGPGYATLKFGNVNRTWHFSSRVVLPKTCVTAAQAKEWAEKLGIH